MDRKDQNQAQRVLDYLKNWGSIDPMQSWTQLGVYRLAAVVHDLRKEGHHITTDRKEVRNRFGEVCKVARYVMGQPVLDQEATKPPPLVIGLAEPVKAKRGFLGASEEPETDPNQKDFDFGTYRL